MVTKIGGICTSERVCQSDGRPSREVIPIFFRPDRLGTLPKGTVGLPLTIMCSFQYEGDDSKDKEGILKVAKGEFTRPFFCNFIVPRSISNELLSNLSFQWILRIAFN